MRCALCAPNFRGDAMESVTKTGLPAKGGLNGNQLKVIAIVAMTIDHLAGVLCPTYSTVWWVLLLHIIGRLTAPIMWFFIAEGFHYTHNLKKYAVRLFFFALISHFAYNFAFGIPFLPFTESPFNQTSVIWSLAWGLVALAICESDDERLKPWVKTVMIVVICAITFCSDWSCIAVFAIMEIGTHRGNFKRQMIGMVVAVAFYAIVYAIFIDPVYGILQMFVVLSIPFLKSYNGQRGEWKGMKWFFYLYYPAHLVVMGLIRIFVGNIAG